MGLDMYLSSHQEVGNELVYWHKAYIIHDWFMDYAEKRNIKPSRRCSDNKNGDEKECYDCGYQNECSPDYNLVAIPIPKEVLENLIDKCRRVLRSGTNAMNEEFPVRQWSKPIPEEERVVPEPGMVVLYTRDPKVEDNFRDIVCSIDKLQELLESFDWENETLYYIPWW